MIPTARVPLVWHNLTHDVRRLALAIGGIGFAVLLVFVQIGFRNALFDSTTKLASDMNADLVLVNKARYALPVQQRFDRTRLLQALAIDGVQAAYPLYVERDFAILRTPGNKGYPIRVLAFELSDPAFRYAELSQFAQRLQAPNTALVDRRTKEKFGLPVHDEEQLRRTKASLSDQVIEMAGTFELGTDFAHDGNLLMSTTNFAHYFPLRARGADPLSLVDFGLLRLAPGANAIAVQDAVIRALPNDVTVLTKDELVRREVAFWKASTPIGFIFTAGTIMGLVVGVIICYQVIYTDIDDHLAEFATLKAMGYPRNYFLRVVLLESLYLAMFGFVPGWLVSYALYRFLAEHTGLLMMMTPARAVFVLVLTMIMCVVSGGLALKKLLRADPAELY